MSIAIIGIFAAAILSAITGANCCPIRNSITRSTRFLMNSSAIRIAATASYPLSRIIRSTPIDIAALLRLSATSMENGTSAL